MPRAASCWLLRTFATRAGPPSKSGGRGGPTRGGWVGAIQFRVGNHREHCALLGLLGTVWGMILTFDVIQTEGIGVVANLAGGISQALISTMAGLTVGIPALVAHKWVLARADRHVLALEDLGLLALMHLDAGGSERELLPQSTSGGESMLLTLDIIFQLVLFFMVSTTFVTAPGWSTCAFKCRYRAARHRRRQRLDCR